MLLLDSGNIAPADSVNLSKSGSGMSRVSASAVIVSSFISGSGRRSALAAGGGRRHKHDLDRFGPRLANRRGSGAEPSRRLRGLASQPPWQPTLPVSVSSPLPTDRDLTVPAPGLHSPIFTQLPCIPVRTVHLVDVERVLAATTGRR